MIEPEISVLLEVTFAEQLKLGWATISMLIEVTWHTQYVDESNAYMIIVFILDETCWLTPWP